MCARIICIFSYIPFDTYLQSVPTTYIHDDKQSLAVQTVNTIFCSAFSTDSNPNDCHRIFQPTASSRALRVIHRQRGFPYRPLPFSALSHTPKHPCHQSTPHHIHVRAMSSTERTRSISGSGPSIMGAAPTAATVCDHHQLGDGTGVTSSTSDLTLHHHNHHSAHGLLANDYVIGTMSLFQNFASGVGEQGGQHSSGSANSSSSAMNISHISSSTESSLTSTAAAAAAANRSGAAINITHNVGAVSLGS